MVGSAHAGGEKCIYAGDEKCARWWWEVGPLVVGSEHAGGEMCIRWLCEMSTRSEHAGYLQSKSRLHHSPSP